MLVSILHRATGDGLAIVGGLILLWWLAAAATGPDAYALFIACASSWLGTLVLVGLTWGFFQHTLSGLRHLAMDTGWGYDVAVSKTTARLTILGSLALTALVWAFIIYG